MRRFPLPFSADFKPAHRRSGWSSLRLLLVIAVGSVAVACPGKLDPAIVELSAQCEPQELMRDFCSGPICHDTPDPAKPGIVPPDLVSGNLNDIAMRLYNVEATYMSVTDQQNCPEEKELLVDSATPDDSLFIKKLEETHSCGVAMPFGMVDKILATDVVCLTDYAADVAAGMYMGPGSSGGGAGGAQ